MAQFGKGSVKRGTTNYAYAIIGVSLVLFLFGIIGWFFINLRKTGDYFKENIQVQCFLNRDAGQKRIDSLTTFIKTQPFIKSAEYITKDIAIKRFEIENDTTWRQFLDNNPLPESIDFYVKASHVHQDSLSAFSEKIGTLFPGVVSDYKFPEEIVTKVGDFAKYFFIGMLIAAAILTILVTISIDNTIRLAMYSNRFLIKTMQMVGATRWFIAKPLNVRAIINGLMASIIAIVLIIVAIFLIEQFRPEFKVLRDNASLTFLFLGIIFMGIAITLISTNRAVLKYLKMKLDDLY
jgi:cell division transport system permease protein